MLVKMDIGGVWVTFGEPNSPNKPAPFYPYLVETQNISDTTGDQTGSTSFTLTLQAKTLVHINVRRRAQVLSDELEVRFNGIVRSIAYGDYIDVGVEA